MSGQIRHVDVTSEDPHFDVPLLRRLGFCNSACERVTKVRALSVPDSRLNHLNLAIILVKLQETSKHSTLMTMISILPMK